MNKEMQDLFYEMKQYLVQHSPKWDTLCDIEQYIIDLEKQLEEKGKVIGEAIDLTNHMIKELDKRDMLHPAETELLEILERGKNEQR